MGDPAESKNQTKQPASKSAAGKAVELSAADAAKAVTRVVPVLDEKGKPTEETEQIAVQEEEVLAWSLRGDRVTVVTIDGQKLVGTL